MTQLFPLTVRQAVCKRRGKTLVGPIDLDLAEQGTTVVIGPNGSGKTMLLRLLHGAARLSSGSITWGCDLAQARRHQAFVFQQPIMLRRSVIDNIAYPMQIRGTPRKQARTEAAAWADKIGLQDMLARSAYALSGGEQQKLAIARAMILQPKLLFLDEPCASLDGRAMREIEEILHQAKLAGTRLIMSTHDMGQARRLADDVIFMLHGRIHEKGAATAFFAAPQTAQAHAFLQGDIVE